MQRDFWNSVLVLEELRSIEANKTIRLTRTRDKVKRVGEIQALKDWALSPTKSDGFEMLIERSRPDLLGEAIVIRHPKVFGDDVVKSASEKLNKFGIQIQ